MAKKNKKIEIFLAIFNPQQNIYLIINSKFNMIFSLAT